jgi:hypothetical protein
MNPKLLLKKSNTKKPRPKEGVKPEALRTIIPESQNIVLSDLDQMGTLIKNGFVRQEEFLDVYWNTQI